MHAWKSASMPIYQKLKQMLPWRRTLPNIQREMRDEMKCAQTRVLSHGLAWKRKGVVDVDANEGYHEEVVSRVGKEESSPFRRWVVEAVHHQHQQHRRRLCLIRARPLLGTMDTSCGRWLATAFELVCALCL